MYSLRSGEDIKKNIGTEYFILNPSSYSRFVERFVCQAQASWSPHNPDIFWILGPGQLLQATFERNDNFSK